MPAPHQASPLLLVAVALATCKPTAPSSSTAPNTAADAAVALVDILQTAPAAIAIASAGASADGPANLVDGDSATSTVVGPWIAFRVPFDTQVDHLEIEANVEADGRRVEVRTMDPEFMGACDHADAMTVTGDGGAKFGTLDPKQRSSQSIAVHQRGGAFCVWFLGNAARAGPTAVSAFRVMGTRGAPWRSFVNDDPAHPTRRLDLQRERLPAPVQEAPERKPFALGGEQSLRLDDTVAAALAEHPHHSVAELCASYVKAERQAAQKDPSPSYPPNIASISCRVVPLPAAFTAAPPFRSVVAIEAMNGWSAMKTLVAETARGFWLTPLAYENVSQEDATPQWGDHGVESIRIENGNLLLVHDWIAIPHHANRIEPVVVRLASWCAETTSSGFGCWRWSPEKAAPLAVKGRPWEFDERVIDALPWQDEIAFSLEPNGALTR